MLKQICVYNNCNSYVKQIDARVYNYVKTFVLTFFSNKMEKNCFDKSSNENVLAIKHIQSRQFKKNIYKF